MTWSRHHWPAAPDPGGQRPDLSSTFVGRLVFPTGHGPRSIIVECHPADDGFTIHLPEFNEAANYLVDTTVTLTAVETESTDPVAVITGRSQLLADRDVDADATEALERWCDDIPAHYFRITSRRSMTRPQGRADRHGGECARTHRSLVTSRSAGDDGPEG